MRVSDTPVEVYGWVGGHKTKPSGIGGIERDLPVHRR